MLDLQKDVSFGVAPGKAPRQIQSHDQKKKIPQFTMDKIGIGPTNFSLRQMHQGNGQKTIKLCTRLRDL